MLPSVIIGEGIPPKQDYPVLQAHPPWHHPQRQTYAPPPLAYTCQKGTQRWHQCLVHILCLLLHVCIQRAVLINATLTSLVEL